MYLKLFVSGLGAPVDNSGRKVFMEFVYFYIKSEYGQEMSQS